MNHRLLAGQPHTPHMRREEWEKKNVIRDGAEQDGGSAIHAIQERECEGKIRQRTGGGERK